MHNEIAVSYVKQQIPAKKQKFIHLNIKPIIISLKYLNLLLKGQLAIGLHVYVKIIQL